MCMDLSLGFLFCSIDLYFFIRGMVWGGRREDGSGWGTHVYLWRIHFDIWQNQYNIVKFKNKIRLKKKASILWHSAFFIVQPSHPYMTTGKIIALTR